MKPIKPEWEDAPDWANWLYPCLSGTWYWASTKPKWRWIGGYWEDTGIYRPASKFGVYYPLVSQNIQKVSLESRPEKTTPEAGVR